MKQSCLCNHAVCIVVMAGQYDSEEYKLYSACLRKPSSQSRVNRSHLKFPRIYSIYSNPENVILLDLIVSAKG
jgi:hypothetical protein